MPAWLCLVLCLSWSFANGSLEHVATAIASPDGASVEAEDLVEHPVRTVRTEPEQRRALRLSAAVRDTRLTGSIADSTEELPVAPLLIDRRRELRRARAGGPVPHAASDEPGA